MIQILNICILIIVSLLFFVSSTKPKITELLKNPSRDLSSKFQLFCSLEKGSKPLQIEWLFNGHSVTKNSRIVVQNVGSESSVLIIEQLESSDSGNYSCRAKNHHGIDVQSTILSVKGLSSVFQLEQFACILYRLVSLLFRQFPTFHLFCHYSFDHDSDSCQSLIILLVKMSQILNLLFLFLVILLSVDSVYSSRPKITDFPKNPSQNLHSKFQLFCSLQEGSKPFHIEWLLNGISVVQNSRILIKKDEDSSVLVIQQLESSDSGNYSCRAKNRHGSDQQSTILSVKGLFFSFLF